MGIIVIDLAEGRTSRKESRKRKKRKGIDGVNYNSAAVIAIDPGGVTGWSFMCVDPNALHYPDEMVLDNITTHFHGELSSEVGASTDEGEDIVIDDLTAFIEAWPQAAIIIEDFILRSNVRSRELLSPVRITSAIKHLLWKDERHLFKQTPADAKTTASNERLKNWGLYDSHGTLEHARDADRHAITFLRKAKSNPKVRAKAWPHLFHPGTGLYTKDG